MPRAGRKYASSTCDARITDGRGPSAAIATQSQGFHESNLDNICTVQNFARRAVRFVRQFSTRRHSRAHGHDPVVWHEHLGDSLDAKTQSVDLATSLELLTLTDGASQRHGQELPPPESPGNACFPEGDSWKWIGSLGHQRRRQTSQVRGLVLPAGRRSPRILDGPLVRPPHAERVQPGTGAGGSWAVACSPQKGCARRTS